MKLLNVNAQRRREGKDKNLVISTAKRAFRDIIFRSGTLLLKNRKRAERNFNLAFVFLCFLIFMLILNYIFMRYFIYQDIFCLNDFFSLLLDNFIQ